MYGTCVGSGRFHVRQSSFKLLNWGRAKGKDQQAPQGENSLGYNIFYGHYGQDEEGKACPRLLERADPAEEDEHGQRDAAHP